LTISLLLFLVDSLIVDNSFYLLAMTGIISVVANNLIDFLGHEVKGKYIARTPRTHTFPRSIGWGLLVSIPLVIILYYFYPDYHLMSAVILDGLMVGPSHMLLDIFTERGIYHKVNRKWKRIALAHFSYDDPFANGLAFLLGIIMLFIALHSHDYYHYYQTVLPHLFVLLPSIL
jgi:hypothetical protein